VSVLLGVVLPILPVQILWINMTTALFLGLMLTFEPKEPDLMERPPRDPKASFLNFELLRRMVIVGVAMLIGAFAMFKYEMWYGSLADTDLAEAAARTVAVNVFVMVEAFYLFNCRHLRRTAWESGLGGNPWAIAGFVTMVLAQLLLTYSPVMNAAFHTVAISGWAWVRVLAVAVAVFLIVEVETYLTHRHEHRRAAV